MTRDGLLLLSEGTLPKRVPRLLGWFCFWRRWVAFGLLCFWVGWFAFGLGRGGCAFGRRLAVASETTWGTVIRARPSRAKHNCGNAHLVFGVQRPVTSCFVVLPCMKIPYYSHLPPRLNDVQYDWLDFQRAAPQHMI